MENFYCADRDKGRGFMPVNDFIMTTTDSEEQNEAATAAADEEEVFKYCHHLSYKYK